MASELELARRLAGLADNPSGAELIAAQWKHAAGMEPLQAAVYLLSFADPAAIVGGADKVAALRKAAKEYSTELTKKPPDASKLATLRVRGG